MRRPILILTIALLGLAARADALVLCAKGKNGTVKQGVPLKVRTACTGKEVAVDPDALAIENAADAPIEGFDLPLTPVATGSTFSIQFDTPDVGSVTQGEAAVRGVPGVRSAVTRSLALGGTSVMQVTFDGTVDSLRAGLQARGYTVAASGTTLRITRRAGGAPGTAAPAQ